MIDYCCLPTANVLPASPDKMKPKPIVFEIKTLHNITIKHSLLFGDSIQVIWLTAQRAPQISDWLKPKTNNNRSLLFGASFYLIDIISESKNWDRMKPKGSIWRLLSPPGNSTKCSPAQVEWVTVGRALQRLQ